MDDRRLIAAAFLAILALGVMAWRRAPSAGPVPLPMPLLDCGCPLDCPCPTCGLGLDWTDGPGR